MTDDAPTIDDDAPETPGDLTPRRERAALALAVGATNRAAAKEAGVNERSLFEWRQDPAFRARVAAIRGEVFDRAVGALAASAAAAALALRKLLEDPDPGIRLRAAAQILEKFAQLRMVAEVDARVLALEAYQSGPQPPRELTA